MRRHPSQHRLLRWADGDLDRLTRHIESCPRCQAHLEELTEFDHIVRRGLRLATDPRPGFPARLETAMAERQRNAETWSVIGDLFSVGWRTLEAIIESEDEDD